MKSISYQLKEWCCSMRSTIVPVCAPKYKMGDFKLLKSVTVFGIEVGVAESCMTTQICSRQS